MRSDIPPIQPKWLNPHLPREGRYVLGPLLGKGGMGEVMEAWDVVLCRTVALKALRNMEPPAMIRFMHEAQIQARVVHPNICRIYDIESSEGTLKIAMQLIKGPNLEQASKQLTVDEVVAIMGQVAEAVHAAHRVNLIHRDLKPSNIILERIPDGPWIPYLCDFGLAVSVGEPAMTMSQSVVGTPAFMAPEQTRGDRANISPATDVYALGGTLHFALLGYPPGQLASSADPSRAPKAGLPRDLDTIIRKCLQAAPEQRYSTAAALAEDLWRFRNGEPIHARPRRRWVRLPVSFPRRGKRMLAAVSAVALLALSLAGFLGTTYRSHLKSDIVESEFILDAESAVADFQAQQILPIHDLRPAQARLRDHIAGFRTRMNGAGTSSHGAAWFAIGRCSLFLGEFRQAREAFEKAGSFGFRGANLGRCQACALAEIVSWSPELDHAALPEASAFSGEERDLFRSALDDFLRKDYVGAVADARMAQEDHPSLLATAVLETAALCALGKQRYQAGDLPGAEARFQEAVDSIQKKLQIWKSSETLHHAYARACQGLAEVRLERGARALPLLKEMAAQTDLALQLNPDSPSLQEDWIATRFLTARFQAAQDQPSGANLEEAVAFMGTHAKDPSTQVLRAERMLIYWQLADWSLRHREDPGPALLEALRNAETTMSFNRDYLGDVLIFKARMEAARGQDPRPTLDNTLERLQPQDRAGWAPLETAAEAWYIRAEWEQARSLDPAPSLAKVHGMADQALRVYPGASGANAITGLAFILEMKQNPAKRALLLPAAREHLRSAHTAGGDGRLVTRLAHDLPGVS